MSQPPTTILLKSIEESMEKDETWAYEIRPGAGQKTAEFFVYRSSNEKWRHIRFKLRRAACFTEEKNGVSICQDFLLFATHQVRFLSNRG